MAIEINMDVSTIIKGLKIIVPSAFEENRGSIWTSYSTKEVGALLPKDLHFKHEKSPTSKKNVLRGIHGDHRSWTSVSYVSGTVLQVVVDMCVDAETFLRWESFDLGGEKPEIILIPTGLENTFYFKSDQATYRYKLAYAGEYADANDQFTVEWNDPQLNIVWATADPILSERDQRL